MNLPRFIQIHTLHNYPGALLNRDDAGLAKRLPYGNAMRTRISSQCLKRHWRVADDRFSLSKLDVPMAVRSRLFPDKVRERLLEEGASSPVADALATTLRDALTKGVDKLLKESAKGKKSSKKKQNDEGDEVEGDAQEDGDQKQAILLGVAEFEHLKTMCSEVASVCTDAPSARQGLLQRLKSERTNFQSMTLNCGLESALFGRMVTSDVLAHRDAAVYVAHAFTVHAQQVENDYFTVVDDLSREAGEQGSAGIFDTELASGLYYGYVVVDVPQLIANLEGEKAEQWASLPTDKRELSARVVQHLLHLIATVSPGAKRGSTAPFEWAKFLLIEAGDWQPRSLAGAFQSALPTDQANMRLAAVQRIAEEIGKLDAAYGAPLSRRFLALDDVQVPGATRLPLAGLGEWIKAAITQADASAEG